MRTPTACSTTHWQLSRSAAASASAATASTAAGKGTPRLWTSHLTRRSCPPYLAGVFLLFGAIGAHVCGPLGALLGSFHVAPAAILCEQPRSSTSPLLAAGWHVWSFCARVVAGCVWSGRKASHLAERSGLTEAWCRIDRTTHATATIAAWFRLLLRVASWPLRRAYQASEPHRS